MTESDLKIFLHQRFSDENRQQLLSLLFRETYQPFTQPRTLVEDTKNVRLAQHIGSVALSDGRNLGIFDVAVTDAVQIARNRKGLRNVAADYIDQNIIHGAFVFFHNPNQIDYRLTFMPAIRLSIWTHSIW